MSSQPGEPGWLHRQAQADLAGVDYLPFSLILTDDSGDTAYHGTQGMAAGAAAGFYVWVSDRKQAQLGRKLCQAVLPETFLPANHSLPPAGPF